MMMGATDLFYFDWHGMPLERECLRFYPFNHWAQSLTKHLRFDKETGTGGSNGATMRFAPEGDHGANAGLKAARDFLEPIKGTSYSFPSTPHNC